MQAKLTVYKIEQCGYYDDEGHHACCDPAKCLTDIHTWIAQERPTIEQTSTFAGDQDGESLPVYCFDAASNGHNDFLLTTWNETPSEDGVVGAVVRSQVAGTANVRTANLPANSIPGYGTHFWFLPAQRRLATVRFDVQPLNGHVGLNRYMRGYLERFSPHVRFDDDSDDGNTLVRNVIGYALDNDADAADDSLRPRFKSVLLRRNAQLDYIRQNRERITRVIRKGRPSGGDQATRSLLDRALTFMGARPNNRPLPDHNFTFEIAYTPTPQELHSIITRYQQEEHETWDDVGFDFRGEPTRHWLSSSTLKVEVELPDNLSDGPASLATATALLAALQPHRTAVLA